MTLNGRRLKELQELRAKVDFESEKLNQYYLKAEILDDIAANSEKCRDSKKYNFTKNYLPQDNYLKDLTEELNDALLMSIRHHETLIKFAHMLEDFINIFVLLKSFQTTVQVGAVTYTFLKIHATFDQYVNLLSYVILTGLDVFSMCYFGEALKSQTTRIGDALCRSPWYLCGGPFRRIASIILANANQPLVITGGKFFVLDFQKITGILKGAFSYFTLLQKIDN